MARPFSFVVFLLFAAVCPGKVSASVARVPLGTVVGATANAPPAGVILPHPGTWRGRLPDYTRFPRCRTISFQVIVASILLAIAFRRIHRRFMEGQALVMGAIGEHLLRGVLPREQDLRENFALIEFFFEGIRSFEPDQLLEILQEADLPRERVSEVRDYLVDYANNGLGMTSAFPEFLHIYNPWAVRPVPDLAGDQDDGDDSDDGDGENDENDENVQNGPAHFD